MKLLLKNFQQENQNNLLKENNMSKQSKQPGGIRAIVGFLLTFLFSNVFLLIYGLFKTKESKDK